jgi:hypothetical protein
MDYKLIYDNIILKARGLNRNKNDGKCYYENHHIIPKSFGGSNRKENRVLLTAKEHFLCHKLLVEIYPDSDKMVYAMNRMMFSRNCFIKRDYKISSREYAWYRKLHSEKLKGSGNPNWNVVVSKQTRDKISKSNTGFKVSDETKRLLSKNNSGKGNPMYGSSRKHKDNPFYGKKHSDETRSMLSKKLKGLEKVKCVYCGKETNKGNHAKWHGNNCLKNPNMSHEAIKVREKIKETLIKVSKTRIRGESELQKMKERMMSDKNPFYGKKHSEETKETIRKKAIERHFNKH